MKAYKAWAANDPDAGGTVIFAETAGAAKAIATHTDACGDVAYTNIRVCRFPQMDGHDRGRREIDWYDPEDRKALVALGWSCLDTSWECETCPEKAVCCKWADEAEENR